MHILNTFMIMHSRYLFLTCKIILELFVEVWHRKKNLIFCTSFVHHHCLSIFMKRLLYWLIRSIYAKMNSIVYFHTRAKKVKSQLQCQVLSRFNRVTALIVVVWTGLKYQIAWIPSYIMLAILLKRCVVLFSLLSMDKFISVRWYEVL